MARIERLTTALSSTFADAYDVYVDYGKGRPVKMNDGEAAFIDVERFLLNQFDSLKILPHERGFLKSRSSTPLKGYSSRLATCNHRPTDQRVERDSPRRQYPTTFTPTRLSRSSSASSSSRKELKVFSTVSHRAKKTTLDGQSKKTADLYRPLPWCAPPPKRLGLRIAVNGASKDLRGPSPASNRNLTDGDFGDDAGMFVENGDTSFLALADGAGGNRSLGLNPADFSRAILAVCRSIAVQKQIQAHQLPALVIAALRRVEASTIRGSSTFCVLAMDRREPVLTSLNIGDSGFIIYRHNKIYRRSECTSDPDGGGPRQLFALDNRFGLPDFHQEKTLLEASSSDRIPVQKDDLIILSSDGLWDVLEAHQLQRIVERNAHRCLQDLANDLLAQAMRGYAVNSRDDILIIVGRVEER